MAATDAASPAGLGQWLLAEGLGLAVVLGLLVGEVDGVGELVGEAEALGVVLGVAEG